MVEIQYFLLLPLLAVVVGPLILREPGEAGGQVVVAQLEVLVTLHQQIPLREIMVGVIPGVAAVLVRLGQQGRGLEMEMAAQAQHPQ